MNTATAQTKKVAFYKTIEEGGRSYSIRVEVDLDSIATWMGRKAARNRTKKSTDCGGDVLAWATEVVSR